MFKVFGIIKKWLQYKDEEIIKKEKENHAEEIYSILDFLLVQIENYLHLRDLKTKIKNDGIDNANTLTMVFDDTTSIKEQERRIISTFNDIYKILFEYKESEVTTLNHANDLMKIKAVFNDGDKITDDEPVFKEIDILIATFNNGYTEGYNIHINIYRIFSFKRLGSTNRSD